MNHKIVKYITFAVAIVDILIACWFSYVVFDDSKKDNYAQAQLIETKNPALMQDVQAATPDKLPAVVEKYQKQLSEFNTQLNAQQRQKDILYTYIMDLKDLNEGNFKAYKENFSTRAESLFATCDKKDEYIKGFNGVADYSKLEGYLSKIDKDYAAMKQNYLLDRNYLKAANSMVSSLSQISASASAKKKAEDLTAYQNDLKAFKTSSKLENAFVLVGYFLGLVTLLLMLFFACVKLFKNFKSSYKILLVLLGFAIIVFIGYLTGSAELSKSAIKMGLSVNGYKMVNAACITIYVCLLVAILSIFATAIINAIKNRK